MTIVTDTAYALFVSADGNERTFVTMDRLVTAGAPTDSNDAPMSQYGITFTRADALEWADTRARFANIAEVRRANKRIGHYFFSPDTMSFFSSRVESDIINVGAEQWFITSERMGDRDRTFHARMVSRDGSIGTYGDGYATMEECRAFILYAHE